MQKDIKYIMIVMIITNMIIGCVFVVGALKFIDNDAKIVAIMEQQAIDSKFVDDFSKTSIELDTIRDKQNADVRKLLKAIAVALDKQIAITNNHADVINQHAGLLNDIKQFRIDVKEVLQYLVNRK